MMDILKMEMIYAKLAMQDANIVQELQLINVWIAGVAKIEHIIQLQKLVIAQLISIKSQTEAILVNHAMSDVQNAPMQMIIIVPIAMQQYNFELYQH